MKTVEDKVLEIVSFQLGVRKGELARDKAFIEDLAADTLDHVELIMAIEEEFDLCIVDEDAERINTVGDLLDYVKARVESVGKK